jgi:hypothetical protein
MKILLKVINYYLIPWPGPQVISVACRFLDPSTIDIQSSPANIVKVEAKINI